MRFCHECGFTHSGARFFLDFSWKVDAKFGVFFQGSVWFFQPGEPLNSSTGAMVWALFAFLVFFEISGKIDQKAKQNRYPQKTSKNWSREVPEWTKNGSEFIGKWQKISKMASKTWNLKDCFFDDFSDCQKTSPGGGETFNSFLKIHKFWSRGETSPN